MFRKPYCSVSSSCVSGIYILQFILTCFSQLGYLKLVETDFKIR